MPRLILFAVCEKVILDNAGNASIINLMHSIEVASTQQGPVIGPIPRNAVSPAQWSIYAIWKPGIDDPGKEFSERIEILWPDRTVFNAATATFRFEANRNHQNTAGILGFPAGQTGDVVINMWLECEGRRIGETSSWIVTVSHKQRPN